MPRIGEVFCMLEKGNGQVSCEAKGQTFAYTKWEEGSWEFEYFQEGARDQDIQSPIFI